MSDAVFMEYMGFISTTQGREYAFHVRFSAQDSRDYTVTIAREAFSSRRVSYQDGPGVCSSRLKQELTANPDALTGTSFLVDEREIDDHKARDTSETPKRRHGPKLPTAD
ncbi:MAG TPA: hypothetical protein VMB47_06005 [Candidatus Aquilonibacter sp.]|nr:hypothetical protein [Candidatus Aquilonibacter sp.]